MDLQLSSSYLADQEPAAWEGECKGVVKNFLALMALFILSPTTPLRGREKIAEDERFIKTMRIFVESEGLGGIFVPAYICASRKEVCGKVLPGLDLQDVLSRRADFTVDLYNFRRAHPGASYSYRGSSGESNHYSLHIVGYGQEVASVHVDVRLPRGRWGNIEHNIRDVAVNRGKIYILRIRNSHTSETRLLRNFPKWWKSYQTAFPEFAGKELPAATAYLLKELLGTNPKPVTSKADYPLN